MRLFLGLWLCFPLAAFANDSSVSVGLGGITFQQSDRIAMDHESLRIAKNKVTVEYRFTNESGADVATEVGFPLPKDSYGIAQGSRSSFRDFQVWVDGKKQAVERDVRCLLKSKSGEEIDISADLKKLFHADLADLDRVSWLATKFPEKKKEELVAKGWFANEGGEMQPLWENSVLFHWHQKFPRKKTIAIKHTYTPEVGTEQQAQTCLEGEHARLACLDEATRKAAQKLPHADCAYVDYIVTTARNWKGPIKSFDLILEKKPGSVVSACEDDLKPVGQTEFRAHRKNFVPQKEIRVYFYSGH